MQRRTVDSQWRRSQCRHRHQHNDHHRRHALTNRTYFAHAVHSHSHKYTTVSMCVYLFTPFACDGVIKCSNARCIRGWKLCVKVVRHPLRCAQTYATVCVCTIRLREVRAEGRGQHTARRKSTASTRSGDCS